MHLQMLSLQASVIILLLGYVAWDIYMPSLFIYFGFGN